jgi:poly(A) polymerase
MEFKQLFEIVRSVLPAGSQVYLVGGAVRDLLLGKAVHDLDFAMAGDTRKAAQGVARKLDSPFFMLDDHRLTARVLFHPVVGEEYQLDFAALAQDNLETDLRQRDFTIDAIAAEINHPEVYIDPCGGQKDLEAGLLRTCSSNSMLDDPLRVLRGVRLAYCLDLSILPQTEALMAQAAPELERVSPERQRDELLRILEGPRPESAIRLLDRLGATRILMPELEALKGANQTAPHVLDVWEHTLHTLRHLEALLDSLVKRSSQADTQDSRLVKSTAWLQAFDLQVSAYLTTQMVPGRSIRSLLFFEALYHDIAKPVTMTHDESGQIHHYGHAEIGAEMAADRARWLALSKAEIDHLHRAVAYHMRLHFLAQNSFPTSRRAIYRFFRKAGQAGVDICLISLADTLATYGPGMPDGIWEKEVMICRAMLEAWWEKPAESVRPMQFLNGNDLKASLGLKPGPLIGQLLELLSEAQAAGEVTTRDEALEFIRKKYDHSSQPN